MAVTATLVVNFQARNTDESSSALQLIIDDRETADGGLNGGQTTFYPGDSVYILRFKTNDITIQTQGTTSGTLSTHATGLYQITDEYLLFANAREANLSKPYTSGLTYSWIGNSLGSVAVVNQTKILAGTQGYGVLKISYKSAYTAYRLHSVPLAHETVMVYSAGDIAA